MALKAFGLRYGRLNAMSTRMQPLEDLIAFFHGLSSAEFMQEAVERHSALRGDDAKAIAAEAASYVSVSLNYLEQAKSGNHRIAGLPLYYAALNLSKVVILLGPYREHLPGGNRQAAPENKYHGLRYDPLPPSVEFLDEEVEVKQSGVFPLLYRTLTGEQAPQVRLSMRDVYSRVLDIGAEYEMVTGHPNNVLECRIGIRNDGEHVFPVVLVDDAHADRVADVGALKALKGFTRLDEGRSYRGVNVRRETPDASVKAGEQVRSVLLYLTEYVAIHDDLQCYIPISNGTLLFPEEVPLIIAYFHLSSVARYKPLFLDRIFMSRYSPLILGVQRSGLVKFLMLVWSFVHQKNLMIEAI